MTEALKPCPFCDASLAWSELYREYHHPIAKCILSGRTFKKGMIGQWNKRAHLAVTQPAPDHAAIREAALREAAEVCAGIRQRIANGPMPEGARFDYEQAILALRAGGDA